ncbi:hypothetical protein KDN24_06280 [Bacillus sp. Bva_UNVM-123]|uniref:hypothetical protein n=1 Tax=Bacillus sp. Bva_UNVM-123 TaxID=2829798 RepID=UPI00391EEF32
MKKVEFRVEEVLAYLELLVISDLADEDELELYQDFQWKNKLKINTYNKLIMKMRNEYNG